MSPFSFDLIGEVITQGERRTVTISFGKAIMNLPTITVSRDENGKFKTVFWHDRGGHRIFELSFREFDMSYPDYNRKMREIWDVVTDDPDHANDFIALLQEAERRLEPVE